MASVRRPLLAMLAAVTAALAVTGCVSMPNAGPVLSYPVSQETGGQNGQNLQFSAQPPGAGWNPQQMVSGFLIAAAANQDQVAREYLAPAERKHWNPSLDDDDVRVPDQAERPQPGAAGDGAPAGRARTARRAAGRRRRRSSRSMARFRRSCPRKDGTYAVPSASGPNSSGPQYFTLVKTDGEWRISAPPPVLLLTQAQFADDYDLRNLYFFDPNYRYLVPDPVYVPLQASASTLTSRLVGYLKTPPKDWLAGGATADRLPGRHQGHGRAGRRPRHRERHRDDQQGPGGRGGVTAAVDAGRLGPGRLPGKVARAVRERQAVHPARRRGQRGADPGPGRVRAGHRRQRDRSRPGGLLPR